MAPGILRRGLILLAAGSCLLGATPALAQARHTPSLALHYVAMPSLGLASYDESASYPQVSYAGHNVVKVNSAIARVVDSYVRHYRAVALSAGPGASASERGTVDALSVTTTASPTAVSTLISMDTVFPGGNDGENYLAGTFLTASGKQIRIGSLVTPGGLATLKTVFRERVFKQYACVAQAYDPTSASFTDKAFADTRNYVNFVLLPTGVEVGFEQGLVSYEACGSVTAVVPWSALRDQLSPLGSKLSGSTPAAHTVHPARF